MFDYNSNTKIEQPKCSGRSGETVWERDGKDMEEIKEQPEWQNVVIPHKKKTSSSIACQPRTT